MNVPELSVDDVACLFPSTQNIQDPIKGGQKIVFPCQVNNRPTVIKFLSASIGTVFDDLAFEVNVSEEVMARTQREVDIIARCRSPHVIKLGQIPLGSAKHGSHDLIYFSEEYIEGTSLKDYFRQEQKLSLEEVCRLGLEITRAIAELWRFGKIHRDIKPGNIMRRENGQFVLLDMGLAFDVMVESLTMTGLISGTAMYMSPEQTESYRKRQLDFRSDMFSLGIVLYEALAGRHPFFDPKQRLSHCDILQAILYDDPEPLEIHRREAPDELIDIVNRLLGKEPHLRFRSCNQLIQRFENLLEKL
ncbi:serine/threonine protein kinase [Acanthopleuribacter pedis]|uniref:non-specific serine/threonine protein kinase n=1 Tax=Acanthopleuribacter pedis TaxID=442870 RepID=A0A8J7U196_9BACT|nr:serine/threonine-protein kinase [Acanthopleuribacter pedis]MBO1317943.1 serine/threonine protein kinase [Acanthopleuribacter pedis]